MYEKLILFVILLAISVIFMFSSMTTEVLAAPNDTVTVDVNVSEVSQITLIPTSLSWNMIDAGTAGGYKNITLKNTGSANVSQIFAYVDTLTDEPSNPYESGDPSNYAAGGVLTIRNETDSNYYFIGRIEWNWTQDIPDHVWGVADPVSWGYFRNTTNDYVWVVGNGTTGCNDTDAEFRIEDDIDIGTQATRSPDSGSITRNYGDTDWSYWSVDRTPFNGRSCVAIYKDCTKIYIYSFDKRTSPYNFSACNDAMYLRDEDLAPGDTMTLRVDPWVPYGTPAGNLNTATLTVEAT